MLMSFHSRSDSWINTKLVFSGLGVTLKTLLLLNMVSKVLRRPHLAVILREWHSIETLPKLSAVLIS